MKARRRVAKIESSDDIAVFICRLVFRYSLRGESMRINPRRNDVLRLYVRFEYWQKPADV